MGSSAFGTSSNVTDGRSLSNEQSDRIQKAFNAIDTDSDGSIEVWELKAALEILGVDSTKHEDVWDALASLTKMRGETGRTMNCINFTEFSRLAADRMQRENSQEVTPPAQCPMELRTTARGMEHTVKADAAEAGCRASRPVSMGAGAKQANVTAQMGLVLEAASRRAQGIAEHYMMSIQREVARQIETLVSILHEDNANVLTQLLHATSEGTEVPKLPAKKVGISFRDTHEVQAPGPPSAPEALSRARHLEMQQKELRSQMLLPGGVPELEVEEVEAREELWRGGRHSDEEKALGCKIKPLRGKLSTLSRVSSTPSCPTSRHSCPSVSAANAIIKTRGMRTLRVQAHEATWKDREKAVLEASADDLSDSGVKLERLQEENEIKRKLFVDVHELKDKVRRALLKNKYNVKDLYKTTGLAQSIAKSSSFEIVTMFVVVLNCIWIWVDSDMNSERVLARAETIFQVMEHLFCTYFTFEWFVRFLAFAKTMDAFKDPWFAFDTILFTLTVTDTWFMTLLYWATHNGGRATGMGMDANILKLCRIMRLTRMARMARLVRYMPELLVILRGLWISSKSVFFTLLLLLFTIFVFGITFRQLTDETPVGERYFYSVHGSMISLFLYGTLPDLAEMVLALSDQHLGLGLLMVFFILFATLTIMNMLVGVLVESVSTVSQIENESLMVNMVRAKILQMIEVLELDIDGNGSLSREEFEELVVLPEAAQFIQQVGVDVVGLVEYSEFIFKDQDMSFEEFVDLILQLRGTNTATVKDIVDLRKQVMQEMESITRQMSKLSKESSDRITHVLKQHRAQDILERKASATQEQLNGSQLRQPPSHHLSHGSPPLPRGPPQLLDELEAPHGREISYVSDRPLCGLSASGLPLAGHREEAAIASSWKRLSPIEV